MNAAAERSLAAQREDLCARLRAQRQVIARQLGIDPGGSGGYPRSKTMRLLAQRPELIIRTLGRLASLFRRR